MKLRRLIAVLAALLMLASVMPVTAFAEMGGDFPWTDSEDQMLIEQILERDGFIDGIWFPWFNGGETGHNLTGNDLMADYYNKSASKNWDSVELDVYGADKIYREIYNLKAMGYNIMAYGGSIFAEGVVFDANGDVIGIKQEYLNNARRLLNMCREIGMPVMWNVYFHSSSMPDYYGIEGWHFINQMLGNHTIADHYAENFVRPLCEMLAEYPDVVALVSIADEPENEINDIGSGEHFKTNGREVYGVNQDDMIYFMQGINEVVREELPGVARTVASNSGNKTIYRDFDLDLMGHNQYTDGDSFKSVESLITDADPILTEYNIGNGVTYTDDQYAQKLITFREWMMDNGYKGGFQWCWMTNARGLGNTYFLQRTASDPTSFRKTVTLLKRYMDQYRAEYRGETITVDAPVLYANAGDGKVLFIPSAKATKITIQRSDDGGSTWKNLVTNATQSTYVDAYLVGRYTDTTSRPTSGYCYRIIATDANGNSVTSAPNNLAGADKAYKVTYTSPAYTAGKYYITSSLTQAGAKLTSFGVEKNRPLGEAANLIQNGSFESTGGQWNTGSFLTNASVVNDSTTPDGEKSLYFDTSNKSSEGWYTFTVTGLKQNTEYTFSSFLKGAYFANDNKGMASIGVIDPDTGKYMYYWEYFRSYPRASRETLQMYPTAWDNQWHLRSVTFKTGDSTTATIALYGYSSKMWVDGLALFETINGAKYEDGRSAQAMTSTSYNPPSGATNAVSDPAVNNAAYWNTGAGYKQGFMSVSGGKLQYNDSTSKSGVRYTKWIDVKPGTDYYYSFTVNVTTAGAGRVAILDNSMLLPNEIVKAPFTSTGTKTYTGRISTGEYDKLGFCVVDKGGVATIDNIYLYEGGESIVIPTTPSFDGYIINGDFEIGSANNWENLWGSNAITVVDGRDSNFAIKVDAGQYTHVRQKVTVEKNTDYVIELWVKDAVSTALMVKDGADTTNIKQPSLPGGSSWQKVTLEFNSGNYDEILVSLMGGAAGATYTVDDIKMYKKPSVSNDGYIVNGDFEVGTISGWENLYNFNTVTMVPGRDSTNAIQVVGGQYTQVRQKVAVKTNTDYVIELWSKNASNVALLVKDQNDSANVKQQGLPGGSAWTKTEMELNSGSNSYLWISLMSTAPNGTYTVDDVKMYEKPKPVGLTNGGFEEGKSGWSCTSGTATIVTTAHGGSQALQLTNPGQYGEAAGQTIAVEPNTEYTITWYSKRVSGTGAFNLYVMNGANNANMTATGGQNWMNEQSGNWVQNSYTINTGSATSMIIKFSTEGTNPGSVIIDDVAIAKASEVCTHTYDNACDATCNLCGETRTVPGHSYTGRVTKPATCGATGIRTFTCSRCGDSYTETIPATGAHTYDNACDASCNVCGATRIASHTYSGACDKTCNACGAIRLIVQPHAYDNACDSECNACGETRTVSHSASSAVVENEAAATCTQPGKYQSVVYCTVCGYEISRDTVTVPATGHTAGEAVVENEKAATCGAAGSYDNVVYCTVCGAEISRNTVTVPATGDHNHTATVTKAATCTEAGVKTYTCSCGDTYTEAIPAAGHTAGAAVVENEKAATCGAAGSYDNVVYCSVCGAEISRNTVPVPATGEHVYAHDYDADCNVCGEPREVTLPIAFGGNSVSEDVSGLAFMFTVSVSDVAILPGTVYEADYTNARLGNYKLVGMGAKASNEFDSIEIDAEYLCAWTDTTASFAVRIIKIPADNYNDIITATPYVVLELDGVEVTVYGDNYTKSYNAVLNG